MNEVTVELPFPPSVNRYWRNVKGKTLISKAGREYRDDAVLRLNGAGLRQPLTGRLAVYVSLLPPDRRRRDVDNSAKALLDALAHGGVYLDDSQIDVLHIERRPVWPGGLVQVQIYEIETNGEEACRSEKTAPS